MDLETLRQQPHWSYSSLNQLLFICSQQWAYRHVYQQEPEFTPVNLSFGKAFHRCCAQIAVQRMNGDAIETAEVQAFFAETWGRECAAAEPAIDFGDKTADDLRGLGQRMLAAHVTGLDPNERVVAVNRAFSAPLIGTDGNELPKPLIGEFDCVVEAGGLPVIVDWKTSGRRWPKDKADKDMQATAYLYAAHAAGVRDSEFGVRAGPTPNAKHPTPSIFRYDIVTKAKTPACQRLWTTRGADDFARLVRLAEVAERIVQHELFVPNESSFYCAGCPYSTACEAWHRKASRIISVAA